MNSNLPTFVPTRKTANSTQEDSNGWIAPVMITFLILVLAFVGHGSRSQQKSTNISIEIQENKKTTTTGQKSTKTTKQGEKSTKDVLQKGETMTSFQTYGDIIGKKSTKKQDRDDSNELYNETDNNKTLTQGNVSKNIEDTPGDDIFGKKNIKSHERHDTDELYNEKNIETQQALVVIQKDMMKIVVQVY